MALIIPFEPSVPFYDFDVTLNGRDVNIKVRWNERDLAWYCDWFDADGSIILLGMKLVLGVNLGRTCEHELFCNLIVRLVDTSGENHDAGFDDMGTRVVCKAYKINPDGTIE